MLKVYQKHILLIRINKVGFSTTNNEKDTYERSCNSHCKIIELKLNSLVRVVLSILIDLKNNY